MFSVLDDVNGFGRDYVTALLQLYLGLGFVIAAVSYFAGTNAKLGERLNGVPWQDTLKATEAAAAPLLLLAAFALVQLQTEAMSFLHMVALVVAGVSVLFGTLLTILVPICGWEEPVVDGASDDTAPTKFTKLFTFLKVLKAMGQLLLLSAAFPGVERSQLVCASALARLALFADFFGAIAFALGFKDNWVAQTCSNVVKILSTTPLVSGLAMMDDMVAPGSFIALPFQPMFYVALGLYSLVGVSLVLDMGCGGSVKPGTACDKRVATIESIGKGLLAFGMFANIVFIAMGSCVVELQLTGLRVEWGQPLLAIALFIASLAFLTHLVEFFAPRMDEDAANTSDAGISEPMNVITSRAPCLIMALLTTQMTVDRGLSNPLDASIMACTAPLRLGFLLCGCAVFCQIVMLVGFSISTRDMDPAPVPVLDATGTLTSDTIKIGSLVQLLLSFGLAAGIVSMGVSASAIGGVLVIVLVYPFLSQQGKSNMNEALGWVFAALKSCLGTIGSKLDKYMEHRRKLAEEQEAKKAAKMEQALAAEQGENGEKAQKKSKAEPGEQKKKQPKAQANGKKKKTM